MEQYVFPGNFNLEATFKVNTDAMNINQDYQEILKLEKLLIMAGVPHVKTKVFDGWKITYIGDNEGKCDVIEHFLSYGREEDLLELSGHGDGVIGRISAVEIFLLWSEDYRIRSAAHYRVDKYMYTWKEIIQDKVLMGTLAERCDFKLEKILDHLTVYTGGGFGVESLDQIDGISLLINSAMAVANGDMIFVKALLEYQTRKRLVWYILDMLIQCAIDNQKPEIQVMLIDYKYRNNLFRKKEFEL